MTPIPERVDSPVEAALWMALHTMEEIDQNMGSRAMFAQSVLYQIHASADGPVFAEEIRVIKEVLGIKHVEAAALPAAAPVADLPSNREETMIRDL